MSLLLEIIIQVILVLLEPLEPRIYVLIVTPLPLLHDSVFFVLLPRHCLLPYFDSLSKLLKTLDCEVFLVLKLPRG